MKGLLLVLSVLVIFFSCGCTPSPQKEDPEKLYQNLVALDPPDDQQPVENSTVYIDSVDIITTEQDRRALVIHGSFPDGCTSLDSAEHSVHRDTLRVSLSAWRNPDMMCAQVLTQFSFIYDKFGDQELSIFTTVIVNNATFNIEING